MEHDRQRKKLFVATVLAIVGALSLAVVVTYPFPPATTTPQSAKATSDPSVLELNISVRPNPYYQSAPSYDIDVWEFNSLPEMNNVSTTQNWVPRGVFTSGCDPGWPVGVEVLRGHYVTGNLSEGSPILVNFSSSCQAAGIITRFMAFLPNSSSAIIKGPYPNSPVPTTGTVTYYYFQLGAGDYTVAAVDEWGHTALGYFTMANQS